MAIDEAMIEKVRKALARIPKVEEKKMFRGITFMVDGKMCLTVGDERIMVRLDPELHAAAVKRPGAQTVKMKGRDYKGYIYVGPEGWKAKKDFDYWVGLALDFNKKAKASRKAKVSRKKSK